MHGLAFNVTPDLGYFGNIVPCGINDKSVTSLEKELGYKPDIEEVKRRLLSNFAQLFGATITRKPIEADSVS